MQALHDAILDALFNGGVLPEDTIERLLGDPADGDQGDARSKLEALIQQIIERMAEQGYITAPPDLNAERERRQGQVGPGHAKPRVGHCKHDPVSVAGRPDPRLAAARGGLDGVRDEVEQDLATSPPVRDELGQTGGDAAG